MTTQATKRPVKGPKIAGGKTKTIWEDDDSTRCIVENRDDITAHDNPALTRAFVNKARYATTTTCNVFKLLNACGIKTAFIEQLSETDFLAWRSVMLELENIARRLAVGSYLERMPQFRSADPKKPRRFHRLKCETFLKTTNKDWRGTILPCDDPLVLNPDDAAWKLVHPKKPSWDPASKDGFISIDPESVFKGCGITIGTIDQIVRRTFLVLERAWANLGLQLVDFKIELDAEGRVSDVVDNDSWRLWKDGEQLDKQVFRDHGDANINEIEGKYAHVAEMSNRLRLPRQALVYWSASESDPKPKFPEVPGVTVVPIVGSGHKQTVQRLQQLEAIVRDYPEGGVVVTDVGRSNGLGPIVAAHCPWPVISSCASYKDAPHDIHSSLRLPSEVPLLSTWDHNNAVLAALNILGQTNPAAYAHTQLIRESQDDYISN